jgi:nucleoside-diphosphate-sugar epimerase
MNSFADNTSRLIVLGGTGFVGQHLARPIVSSEHLACVYAVHRSEPEWLRSSALKIERYDVANPDTLLPILSPNCIVLNLLRPDGTGWFTEAIPKILEACLTAKVSRYIHVSSIDVFGAASGNVMTAMTPIKPITPYETEHAKAETAVRNIADQLEVVIARLGAVFGPGGLNVVSFVEEAARAPAWKLALRRVLYGQRRMHLVSVEKVVQSLMFLVDAKDLHSGEIILVTDDQDENNNFAYLQDLLMASFSRPPLSSVPYLPPTVLQGLLKARGISSSNPMKRFQDSRLAELGMHIDYSFSTQLKTYVTYLRSQQ